MARLTKRTVDGVGPIDRVQVIWDEQLKGFGLKVTPAGRKVFVFQYRIGGRSGTTQRVTLGELGALTPDQARREATRLKGEVALGRSPASERVNRKRQLRTDREAPLVSDLASEFLADRRAKKKAATVAEYERLLKKNVLPTLGSFKVAAVTRGQVSKLHLSLAKTPYLANRALAILSAMFRFAELRELRTAGANPCAGIDAYPEVARERYLTSAEFAALDEALRQAENGDLLTPPKLRRQATNPATAKHRPKSAGRLQSANPFAVAALRFLLLSGWREGEVLSLRWDAIDFARQIVTLADTKTGRSLRYVGGAALELLDELPHLEGSPFVFPGAKPGTHLKEIKRLWEAVRFTAGLSDVRLHDLRHSFASVAVSGGQSLPVIGSLLGHTQVATTQRYAHLADDPRRRAANDVAQQVAIALAGERPALRLSGTRPA